MCGRYSLAASLEKFQQELPLEVDVAPTPSYNIAPTQRSWVIPNDQPGQLQQMFWGLVPHWSRDGRNQGRLINARREGIAGKPSFRMPVRQHRCLVPADSFYEWRREGKQKIPYRIMLKSERLMLMAGVFDIWTDGKQEIRSYSIITTDANQEVARLHERMPVLLLTQEQQRRWLDHLPLEEVLAMLQTPPNNSLKYYRVSTLVNSPANNSAELHQEVPENLTLF